VPEVWSRIPVLDLTANFQCPFFYPSLKSKSPVTTQSKLRDSRKKWTLFGETISGEKSSARRGRVCNGLLVKTRSNRGSQPDWVVSSAPHGCAHDDIHMGRAVVQKHVFGKVTFFALRTARVRFRKPWRPFQWRTKLRCTLMFQFLGAKRRHNTFEIRGFVLRFPSTHKTCTYRRLSTTPDVSC
jgi:hypothetical protein